MQKVILFLFLFLISFGTVKAAENPLSNPNNKIGVHILFDYELEQAADFVNSNGGEWGYVTIPIQNVDRDLIKWQAFMDRAKKLRVIPIIRLASEGDYFNTKVWKKPSPEDIVDFANFLDSLSWPTKNRYIIIYNEVNRADEWGGIVNPGEYAKLLNFSVNVFKSKTDDFFIISAGLDNAAPQQPPLYVNQYNYLREMQKAVPGIFNQIDGMSSHSYPNPGFKQPPHILTSKSISSFKYERELLLEFRNKDVPIFITETGWNHDLITDDIKASYYQQAFSTVWSDPGIVTISPFLLHAGEGPFKGFSLLNQEMKPTKQMETIMKMPKVAGRPSVSTYILGAERLPENLFPYRKFGKISIQNSGFSISEFAQSSFRWMMKL